MSAVFATPVAAVLLAVELLLFEWKPRSLIPVTIASVTASMLREVLLGAGPIFPIAAHAPVSEIQMIIAAALGLLAGFGSGLLTVLVYAFEDLFERLPIHWMWWPAIGAVFIGIGGIIEPRVLGVGYETIQDLLRGDIIGPMLIGLLIAKTLVWTLALGSGTSGGVLAPLLIIGGALGAMVGAWLPVGDTGMWALIGMAAMMGGTMRSPFTALVFAIELTHDFNMFPALMIASVAAYGVTVLLMRRSILTEKLARRGHHITREYSIDPFEFARVSEVMDAGVPTIPATMTLTELSARIASGDAQLNRRQGLLIVDEQQRLAGIITRGDIVRALQRDAHAEMTVTAAGSTQPVVTFPDEPLQSALARMLEKNVGRLPVVDRNDQTKILGYLGRAAILSARARFHEEENIRQRQGLLRKPASRTSAAALK
jgi:CBS domain-containing protein